MTPFYGSTSSTIRAVELIGACGAALSSIEWLTNARHLHDDALLSWPISSLRHRALTDGAAARLLESVFRYPQILYIITIRLVAALLLIYPVFDGATRAGLTVLVALSTIAIALRSPFGLDGSDQLATFLFGTLALARLFPRPTVESAFLWVLALQSCLAYFTAGFAKLVSPIWRSGAAIPGISSTRMYGWPSAARLFEGRAWLCAGLAWSVILTECLFPSALFAPLPIAVALLTGGAAFHLLSGIAMGLNTFVWSFLATYPAVLWCHARLYGG